MDHGPDLAPGLVFYCPQAKNVCFLMLFKGCKNKKKIRADDRDHVWPTQPKMLSIWSFPDNVCQAPSYNLGAGPEPRRRVEGMR